MLMLPALSSYEVRPQDASSLPMAESTNKPDRQCVAHSETVEDGVIEPPPPDGEFRHMKWDRWGFAGAVGTVGYLVNDPSNSLRASANSHTQGRFNGLPCAVPTVRRLESRWYAVVFYTDADWGHCN